MKAFNVGVFVLLLGGGASAASREPPLDADVLIQAGHQGRPDCGSEPASLCSNTGAPGEITWTPIVADEATKVLRAAGVRVLRENADLQGRHYRVRDAVFIHFDGSEQPCSTAASVGYPEAANGWPEPARSKEAATSWKALYGRTFPFGFEQDNFTESLRKYYGFKHVIVSDAAFVLEGGEITCPKQRDWLKNRLAWEGDLLAYFLSRRVGVGYVPLPK